MTGTDTKRQIEEIEGGDVVLIDTREPHEYQEAHLEGGKLVPPGLLADEIAAAAPDKSARTILYCRSGNRSYKAAEQRDRYARHTLLPEVVVEGQLKMLNAKVLLVGAGGLGAPTALYLAAAGIGTIGLVDDDV